jgi:hypothetical protein
MKTGYRWYDHQNDTSDLTRVLGKVTVSGTLELCDAVRIPNDAMSFILSVIMLLSGHLSTRLLPAMGGATSIFPEQYTDHNSETLLQYVCVDTRRN